MESYDSTLCTHCTCVLSIRAHYQDIWKKFITIYFVRVRVQHMSGFPYTTAHMTIYVHVKMALILFVSSLTLHLPSPHPPLTGYQSEWWSEAESESGTCCLPGGRHLLAG